MNTNKLTIAALVAALVAPASQAATIYEKDGLKLDFKGDLQVQYRQKTGADDEAKMEYDDLELKFGAERSFGNGTAAYGILEYDFKKEADNGDAVNGLDKAEIGVKFNNLKVFLGKTVYFSDDFSIGEDYEMGGNTAFDTTDGDDVIGVSYEGEGFTAGILTDIAEANDGFDDESALELAIGTSFGKVELGAMYQSFTPSADADSPNPDSIDTLGVSAKLKAGSAKLAASYSTNDDVDVIQLASKFKASDALSFAAGYEIVSEADVDVNHWYANITHAFHKSTKLFLEVGGNDEDDSQTGYLVGLRVRW